MAMDSIQQRNYMMEIMLFIAFYFYCNCKDKKGILFFIILVLVAATFHNAALAFLPFVLFDKFLKKKIKYIIYFYLIICLCMPIYSDYIKTQWFSMGFFLNEMESSMSYYAVYMQKTVMKKDILCYCFLLGLYLVICIFNYLKDTTRYINLTNAEKNYILNTKNFVLYNFCFFPLYPLFSDIAVRFPRNTLLMVFMVITILISRSDFYYRYLLFTIGSFIAICMGSLDLYTPTLRINVDILMNQNHLFEFFGF